MYDLEGGREAGRQAERWEGGKEGKWEGGKAGRKKGRKPCFMFCFYTMFPSVLVHVFRARGFNPMIIKQTSFCQSNTQEVPWSN